MTKKTLEEVLMNPSKSKELSVNFGVVNHSKARFLSSAILSWIKERMLKEKSKEWFLGKITHADKELADIQARSMEIGYNQAIRKMKEELGL